MGLRLMMRQVFDMLRLMLLTFWEKIEDWAYAFFYKKPLRKHQHRGLEHRHLDTFYTYVLLLLRVWFLFPWVCLAVWYITVVHGCAFYATRAYLEGFCLRPYSGLTAGKPWYLDLWDASDAHSSNTLSQYTETLMISHLAIDDARIALQQQAYRLKDMAPGAMITDDLVISLNEVNRVVSDLAPRLETFSLIFCLEKDIMNHALRSFVDSYAMVATLSDSKDLSLPSILFPPLHLMRLLGQYSLCPWLPEPKLYSFEVRAEIRYQTKQLISELTAALDRLDAISPTTQSFQDFKSQNRYLEAAIDKVTVHQQIVREMIDKSGSFLWRWARKSEETANLEKYYRLGQRVRVRLLSVKETMQVYGLYSKRLRSDLQQYLQTIHRSPSYGFSPQGSLGLPAHLSSQIHNVSFLSRRQSSEMDTNGDRRDISQITPHAHVFLYDLDSLDDTRAMKLRSEIAQLCKAQRNVMINSDNLYTVCLIYNLVATMSALDEDALSGIQRSWIVERRAATRRWEQQLGLERDSMIDLLRKTGRDFRNGIPVPEHV